MEGHCRRTLVEYAGGGGDRVWFVGDALAQRMARRSAGDSCTRLSAGGCGRLKLVVWTSVMLCSCGAVMWSGAKGIGGVSLVLRRLRHLCTRSSQSGVYLMLP